MDFFHYRALQQIDNITDLHYCHRILPHMILPKMSDTDTKHYRKRRLPPIDVTAWAILPVNVTAATNNAENRNRCLRNIRNSINLYKKTSKCLA